MPMAQKTLVVNLRPKFKELRDQRTYDEVQVKQILYSFARDLGCKWRANRLRRFIDTAFDFD